MNFNTCFNLYTFLWITEEANLNLSIENAVAGDEEEWIQDMFEFTHIFMNYAHN